MRQNSWPFLGHTERMGREEKGKDIGCGFMNLHSSLILVKVLINSSEDILPSTFPVVQLAMLLLFISIAGVSILEEV